jgi:large subunit ribosomal protein L1
MGKIRPKTIGIEEVESKEKEDAKKRREEKGKMKMENEEGKKENENGKKEEVKEVKTPKLQSAKNKKKEDEDEKGKKKSQGKKYMNAKKNIDNTKTYSVEEAISSLKKVKYAKFDETLELHLNVKESVKGEVSLPHGTGKSVRVVVLSDDLIVEIEKGVINFDILIAHPSMMPKMVKLAKILGPKGLMPTPKNGTLTPDTEKAVEKFKKGTINFKSESKFPIVHQAVGKMSFTDEQLAENVKAFIAAVSKSKINDAYLSATMTPSVKLNVELI